VALAAHDMIASGILGLDPFRTDDRYLRNAKSGKHRDSDNETRFPVRAAAYYHIGARGGFQVPMQDPAGDESGHSRGLERDRADRRCWLRLAFEDLRLSDLAGCSVAIGIADRAWLIRAVYAIKQQMESDRAMQSA
jgi:hypothetical protein